MEWSNELKVLMWVTAIGIAILITGYSTGTEWMKVVGWLGFIVGGGITAYGIFLAYKESPEGSAELKRNSSSSSEGVDFERNVRRWTTLLHRMMDDIDRGHQPSMADYDEFKGLHYKVRIGVRKFDDRQYKVPSLDFEKLQEMIQAGNEFIKYTDARRY